MDIENFIIELKKLNIVLNDKQLKTLDTYKEMLLSYNRMFNLTAIKTTEEVYLKHFYDSLTLTKVINLNHNLKLLDIGTGAGFPGLVLKIVFPELEVTLLDSNNKKITFLEEVIRKLNLKDIKCIYGRAEELDPSYREYFDIVTSRAVAHLRILAELSIPYLKVGGYFIPMKGKSEPEISEAKKTLAKLNGTIEEIIEFMLPVENASRSIIKIKKEKETPSMYPRSYNMIIKKELK